MTDGIINVRPRRESDGIMDSRPRCIWTVMHKPLGVSTNADQGLCGRATSIGRHYTGLAAGTFMQAVKNVTYGGKAYDRERINFLGDICPACERIVLAYMAEDAAAA